MELRYPLKSENEAVLSAKLIYKKCNVPVKVIKIKLEQNTENFYVVIPNPDNYFSNNNNIKDEALDSMLKMKEALGVNEKVFSLP